MKIAHLSIERPVLAAVLSILIVLVGAIAYVALPVSQYPDIVPPTITVTASYPGVTSETAANTVATVLEQQINGVEDMLYMKSENTANGRTTIDITFRAGTDIDMAQVLVQNRVTNAEPSLPAPVVRRGVTVRQNSPDMMMAIHLVSPDGSRDNLYLSNYARTQVVDNILRLSGVGDARIIGERAYAMRVWLDPQRAQSYGLTADEVVQAIRENNSEVAAGTINAEPIEPKGAYRLDIQTTGRRIEADAYRRMIVKRGVDGRVVRLDDVARVELAAQDYSTTGYLDDTPALPIVVFQRPGSNALATAEALRQTMRDIGQTMPDGVAYRIVYAPTDYVDESIDKIYETILEAALLVILVVVLFLQNWRASIIPILAIPVSLIGTFAAMTAFGLSLNNLSLFGLVLAIGIVVDDAIVVVENVERYVRRGMSAREAAHRTMSEVGGALVAISLVLCAVFVPAVFITGMSGAFYRQFALTISIATLISLFVSLTLSPALSALLLKPHDPAGAGSGWRGRLLQPIHRAGAAFDRGFDRVAGGYGALTRRLLRLTSVMLILYVGLIGLTGWQFSSVPTGFIPSQDQGRLVNMIQLPPGATLERTERVVREAADRLAGVPGISHSMQFIGLDGTTFTNASNAGVIFALLAPFDERAAEGLTIQTIRRKAQRVLDTIPEARIRSVMPPPVRGIGRSGGWNLYLQDTGGLGLDALERSARAVIKHANQQATFGRVFTFFNQDTPRLDADIDRTRAEMLDVPVASVNRAIEIYLGESYVNDFNFLNRTYRVLVRADGPYRDEPSDINRIRARADNGAMVPLGSLLTLSETTGPVRVPHYNLYPAIGLQGTTADGFSSGDSIEAMETILHRMLPAGIDFEWTGIALQEQLAGNTAYIAFGLAVLFVFLLLAALYESWLLPFAVILIVPMCLLAAMTGIALRGMNNDIMVQIGLIVLIGLSCKNAILIVEFARQAEARGLGRLEATVEAARVRLRPILMTSLAFILGVVPLMIASGAGAELRRALGTAVFSGMIGVTLFGLLFTPVFYFVCRAGRHQSGDENAQRAD